MQMTQQTWSGVSAQLRREHECTHYITKRVFGRMHNALLDELIADYCAIVAACGRFRLPWLLRFLGVHTPDFSGGRLDNYRGRPALSDGAMAILRELARRSAYNLDEFHAKAAVAHRPINPVAMLFALASLTVEELASSGGVELLFRVLNGIEALPQIRGCLRPLPPGSQSGEPRVPPPVF